VLHLTKSHTEAIIHVPQVINYAAEEKKMKNKGKLWYNHDASAGATAVGKKTSWDKATLNSAKIKAILLAVIK